MLYFLFDKSFEIIRIVKNFNETIGTMACSSCCSDYHLMQICKRWLDECGMFDVEYKVYIEVR